VLDSGPHTHNPRFDGRGADARSPRRRAPQNSRLSRMNHTLALGRREGTSWRTDPTHQFKTNDFNAVRRFDASENVGKRYVLVPCLSATIGR